MSVMNQEVAAKIEADEERWTRACEWLATAGRRRDYPMTEGFMLLSLYKILDANGRTDAHAAAWFQNRTKFKTSNEFHVVFLKQELVESKDTKKQCQILEILKLYEDTKAPIKKAVKPTKNRSSVPGISKTLQATFVREVKFEEPVHPKTPLHALAKPFVPVLNAEARPFVMDAEARPFVMNAEAEPFVMDAEAEPFEMDAEAEPFEMDEVTGPVYSTTAVLMMAKLGYREGWGLGKAENGIREPYAMTIRPPGKEGLGY
jgi:hypothetical protein